MPPCCQQSGDRRAALQTRLRSGRVWLLWAVMFASSGCTTVFTRPVATATQSGLPWLAGFANQPVETTPAFDLTQIQPGPKTGFSPDDLLEITIWDLYEPGKPHTFPARVDSQGQIIVPHVDALSVAGRSAPDVEAMLVETYRTKEILKQPRVLVRELASTPSHVYVTGAVLRPGLINLPRREATVFAALVAAGGLSRNAGLHISVTEQPQQPHTSSTASTNQPQMTHPAVGMRGNAGIRLNDASVIPTHESTPPVPPGPPEIEAPPTPDMPESQPPLQQLTNHSGPLAVSADGLLSNNSSSSEDYGLQDASVQEAIATRPDLQAQTTQSTANATNSRWYDLSVEKDREALKLLLLCDGDVIAVRPAAPPVRITGAVAQPGAYRAPAGNAFGLAEAIQLAGGCGAADLPKVIIVTRPASGDQSLKRWTYRVAQGERIPQNTPPIQPGDLVHVEPTAQARVQSLMGSLWPGK